MRMIQAITLVTIALGAGSALAQEPGDDPARAERARRMVEERFGTQVKEQLGLTDDQAGRLRSVMSGIADKRRTMERQERVLRQALNRQLRPGVAADPDSVGRLVDVLTEQRVAYAETFREEMREVASILTPVQRGQYLLLRDRLIQRVQEIRQSRQGAPARTLPPRP
jgi:Spy/CpxP family protein refolding chaperone